MVVGKVKHYVEIVLNKNKFDVHCQCNWRKSCETRREAFAHAHLHIASSQFEE